MTPLEAVAAAAQSAASATASRDDAIRAAHAAGHSLRAIAAAAGVNHETIRRIMLVAVARGQLAAAAFDER